MCRYQWGGGTPKTNDSTALPFPFASLYLRGRTNGFVMKGGNAAEGKLKTMWDGPRPDAHTGPKGQQCSYQPMRKQGAIILGTGGDNSNRAEGEQARCVAKIAKTDTGSRHSTLRNTD